jgi:two-component system sensor histidine kinase UhpB
MVQEAVTNIARHAEATEVAMALRIHGEELFAEVRDNGKGLGSVSPGRKSYGVLGIRERAQTLGGRARIYSPATGGTVVEIVIPLARYRARESVQ